MADDVHLIVKADFGDHKRGERISDPETVAAVMQTHREYVIPTSAAHFATPTDEPAPPAE